MKRLLKNEQDFNDLEKEILEGSKKKGLMLWGSFDRPLKFPCVVSCFIVEEGNEETGEAWLALGHIEYIYRQDFKEA